MEAPNSFTLESDVGMFVMEKKGKTFGGIRFEGSANGIVCMVKVSGNSYKVTLSYVRNGDRRSFLRIGRSLTQEGMVHDISTWIDACLWEQVEVPGDDDVTFVETTKGRIASYGYNTHLMGIPVIFLHGGPGDGAGTTKMRRLHLDHPVYTYDQMGCGRSDPIPDIKSWNHEDYFRELNEYIERMGFSKVILIGASWGAGLALGYAIRFGCDRIESMILPSPFISSKRWEEDQWVNLKALPQEFQDLMRRYVDGNGTIDDYRRVMSEYYSKYLFTRECNREIAVEAGNAEQNDVFKAMWGTNDFVCEGNMKDLDLIPDLGRITVPVLLMCGDSDEVTLDTLMEYHRLIKGSRVSVVPFAGHVLSMEQPEAYADAVKGFLREYGQ